MIGLCLLILGLGIPHNPHLVLDAKNNFQLPVNFRATNAKSNLHLFGSAQFSEANLRYVLQNYPKPSYIFDLRQESHGFLNGSAISWYGKNNWANLNKNGQQVEKIENKMLAILKNQNTEIVYQTKPNKDPMEIHPTTVSNEQSLAQKYNIQYVRIPVPDHRRPSDQEVDNFLKIIRQIPAEQWIYLHCRGGRGRTTTFMAMVDMMRNAKNNKLEEILDRQHRLGGSDFSKVYLDDKFGHHAQERYQFLKDFYDYCYENHNNFSTSWSQWISK
jgi:hypothetical protein